MDKTLSIPRTIKMTKRKPELDLTSEETPAKELKIESLDETSSNKQNIDVVIKDIVWPGLINFADYDKRKRYHPDTCIISKDEIKLYYHKNKLVDIEYFDKIYNGNMEEAKTGNINLDYNAIAINLMLNFIESTNTYKENVKNLNNHFGISGVLFELTVLANYIQYKDLENICFYRWEINRCLDLRLIELYTKYNRDMKQLMINTIRGMKSIDKNVPTSFLSNCYDLGMNDNKDGVILNIIPFYDPTEIQLSLFKLNVNNYPNYSPDDAIITPESLLLAKFESLKNIAHPTTLKAFIEKYKNVNGNPGVTKFLHLLASFMIV